MGKIYGLACDLRILTTPFISSFSWEEMALYQVLKAPFIICY